MFPRIYGPNSGRFFTVPGLAWEVALKKTEAELELSRDIDVLLMVEKEIRGGETCNTIDV